MSKSQRKYRAIETMEKGITAYLVINSLLDMYTGEEHEHVKLAKFVAKATLNELLDNYIEKNSNEQLQALLQRLDQEATQGGDSNESSAPAIPSV